ncbi:MAG: acetamidase/formamidase family protein [Candidatus Dormibacteraceae bacterium]
MPGQRTFHLGPEAARFGWSRDFEPAATVPSGAELVLEPPDSSGGQLHPGATDDDVAALNFEHVNPVCGPVVVEGADPGDTLQVDILEMSPATWGWTAQIPGFGLLSDQFPDPWVHTWTVPGSGPMEFLPGIAIPVAPFCGVIGLAPAEPGVHSVVPPRRVGGNLDVRHLGSGATLYLPVEVPGALLGLGDTHAAQGDGEVCGTAVEAPMAVTLRLRVRKDLSLETPEYDLPGATRRAAASTAGCHGTTGVGPDLFEAARQAVMRMIDHLMRRHGLDAQHAYALCSIAVDLQISEIVDAPNWVVSALLPLDLFAGS